MEEKKSSSYKENLKKMMDKANIREDINGEKENNQVISIKQKQDKKKEKEESKEEILETKKTESKNDDTNLELFNRLQAVEEFIKKSNQEIATTEQKPKISAQEQINCLIEEILTEIQKEIMPEDGFFDEVKEDEIPFILRKPTFSQPARPAIHKIFDILADSTNKFTKYEIFEKVVIAGVRQYLNKKE